MKKGLSFYESSSTVFADLVIATFSLFLIAFFSLLVVLSDNLTFLNDDKSLYILLSLTILFFGCLLFYFFIKKRLIRYILGLKKPLYVNFKLKRKSLKFLLKIDLSLYKISTNKINIFKATLIRLLGLFLEQWKFMYFYG